MQQSVKIFLFFLVSVVIAVMLASCSPEYSDVEHVQRAQNFHSDGDIFSAVIELKSAVQVNPNNAEARFLLGTYYNEAGDWPTAEKEFRRAQGLGTSWSSVVVGLSRAIYMQEKYQSLVDDIKLDSTYSPETSADLHAYRSMAYLALGEMAAAKSEGDIAAGLSPQTEQAGVALARLRAAKGEFELAKKDLLDSLIVNPKSGDLYRLLAKVESALGNNTAAIDAYDQAINNRLDNVIDYLDRGFLHSRNGEFESAASDFAYAKKGLPKHPFVYYGLGELEFNRKNYPQAQVELEKSLALAPNFMPVVYYLGVTHFLQSNYEQAGALMGQFLQKYPSSSVASRILAAIALSEKNYARAEELLLPVVEGGDDSAATSLLSRALIFQGKLDQGAGQLKRQLEWQPQSLDAQMGLALISILQGDSEAGIAYLEEAKKLDPDALVTEVLIISAHLREGRFDEALKLAEQLIEAEEKEPVALYLMGIAYLGKGQETKAIASLEKALTLKPDFLQSSILLARTFERKGNYDVALGVYTKAQQFHQHNLRLLLALAKLQTRLGNVEPAKVHLEEALKVYPGALAPTLFLSRYYRGAGDLEQAAQLLGQVEKFHSESTALLIERSELAISQGDNLLAIELFEKLLEISDQSPEAHYLLAKAYGLANKREASRQHLLLALKGDPDNVDVLLAMVRSDIRRDELQTAKQYLDSAEHVAPQSLDVMALRGKLHVANGRYTDAIASLTAVAEQKNSSSLVLELANAYWLAKQWEDCITIQQVWLQSNTSDVAVLESLAKTHMQLNQHQKAADIYRGIVDISPDNIIALNNLAWLLRDSDRKAAIKMASKALQLNENNSAVLDTLAVLYLKDGQNSMSLRYAQRAVNIVPSALGPRFHLAQAHLANGEVESAKAILIKLTSQQPLFPELPNAKALLDTLK